MGLLSTIGAASGRAFGFTRSAIAAATDAFFNRVTLLLPGNGTNGAQNNTFLDSSTNNFTITRNGNTTQGTFSPFSQTGWSVNLDGTGDYLTVADNAVLDMGSSSFTMEFWTYITGTLGTYQALVSKRATTGTYGGISLYVTSSRTLNLQATLNGSTWGVDITTTSTVNLNEWAHIAVVRNGNVWTVYINGTSGATTTVAGTVPDNASAFTIGAGAADGGHNMVAAYISNFRLVKGTALYTANFTPTTSALTTTSQGATATEVELLTCQGNRFIDNSDNAFAITVNGNPSIQAFSPFAPTAAYSAATVGGSGYFDGSGDFLSLASNAAWNLDGDFTVEFWAYITSFSDNRLISVAVTNGLAIYVTTSGFPVIDRYGVGPLITSSTAVSLNSWNHISAVRSGSSMTLYLNGSSVGTATSSHNFVQGALYIATDNSGRFHNGWMSGIKWVKGTATAPSGIPTAPPTNTTNTQLLCNFTNAGITDATAKNVLETVGNAQISTTQSKFGGSSMYFDGTGDYLTSYNGGGLFRLGTVYTIEMWFYTTTVAAGNAGLINFATTVSGNTGLNLYRSSAEIVCNDGASGGTGPSSGASSVSANTWTYLAVVCNGTTTKIYLDGVEKGSYTGTTGSANSMTYVTIGAFNDKTSPFSGYIDDLRVTRGVARTITTPTAAFALQ